MKQLSITLFFLFAIQAANAQYFPVKNYPQGYFRNPMGIPLQLSANFGELRSNHFHMGLDIRTAQRENMPVYAAATGYISRVKIERYGFGRAIYINHPNGFTTLYAHLNNFFPALHQYIINKQYADEQWEQDITFNPGEFVVSKGQFIANSGNTGGSQGPHLHFEIRETATENNLNPLLFNFGLADNIPPAIYKLYYYDRRYSTYQLSPKEIKIKGSKSAFTSVDNVVVLPTPTLSFAISAEDKTSTSQFMFGIYQAEIWIDDTLRNAFQLDNFSYNESRYINGSIDYKVRAAGGRYIQYISRLPGNYMSMFTRQAGDGVIMIGDTLIHTARVIAKDAAGNATTVGFRFRYDPSQLKQMFFTDNSIPMHPGQQSQLSLSNIVANFSDKAFYHTVPFVHSAQQSSHPNAVSWDHYLHNYSVPVHDSFSVRLQVTDSVPEDLKKHIVMQMVSNRKVVAAGGEFKDNWLQSKFWDLGVVRLLLDTVPPTITLAGWTNNSNVRSKKNITMVVKDDVGEIKNFRATLDGKWIMFSRKDYAFIHTFDERTAAGKHELEVTVEDIAGNLAVKRYNFSR